MPGDERLSIQLCKADHLVSGVLLTHCHIALPVRLVCVYTCGYFQVKLNKTMLSMLENRTTVSSREFSDGADRGDS